MKRSVKCFMIVSAAASRAAAQAITGSSLELRSSGATASGGGWTLNSDGYVGTYINLSTPTAVTFTLNASGVTSNSVTPDMMLSIADSSQSFSVSSSNLTNYTYTTPTLAAGTYFVRTQLDNQTATASPTLTIGSLNVSGTGVTELNTANASTNALNAATTYATNYREGNATISLSNLTNSLHLGAGSQVQVKLIDNAFNFAGAVYGNSTSDASWINVGPNGQNLAPNTTEEINYQKAILANFNMIVPSNAGKWSNTEATQGSPTMNLVDAMTQFASQNNLGERMHNLLWHNQQPSYINSMFNSSGNFTGNLTTLNNDITSRINYYVSGTNTHTTDIPRTDSYTEMDVLNEPWHGQSPASGEVANYIGTTALGVFGVANVYSQVAAAVKAAGANTRLYTNEYNVLQFSPQSISTSGAESGSDPYANWYLQGVQGLQRAGAPISGIGAEMYVGTTAPTASAMEDAFQNLSVAKDPNGNPIPLTLTEFGNSGSPTAATYDAALQLALTMTYGTPQATTFGYWGGIGGPHSADSIYALYDDNYNLTSAGTTWQNWMNQWNTNDTLTTDSNGNINFTGTYGEYDVIVNGQTYTLDLTKGTTNYGLQVALPTATWSGAGANANWSTSPNWTAALSANSTLVFAGSTNLSPNNDTTAGNQFNGITFNSGAGPFTLGGNAIALAGDVVNNSTNPQSVNIALALQRNTNFNAASGNLSIGGNISGAFSLTKTGSNSLTLSGTNTYTGPTAVSTGTLVIAAAAALPANTALSINGSSVMQLSQNIGTVSVTSLNIPSTGTLDLTNNAMFINYGTGPDPISTIAAFIASGFAGGAWNGTGIVSSLAANSSYGIGYADSADPGNPANLAPGQIEIVYTLLGDANLDGKVNGSDFNILAANFNTGGDSWDQGDFTYDGKVNGSDFDLLAANFNQGYGIATANDAVDLAAVEAFGRANGLLTSVPEPASLGLGIVALGFFSTARRRRR